MGCDSVDLRRFDGDYDGLDRDHSAGLSARRLALRKRYNDERMGADRAVHARAEPAGGRPRKTPLRAIVDAIVYLASTGCQWRALPKDFPPVSTVQGYFYRWSRDGTWLKINHALVILARERCGREASPTAGVIDSLSVKTTESGGPRGFDAGKKIKGRKRHIVTDTEGHLVGLQVHAADIQDLDGAVGPH